MSGSKGYGLELLPPTLRLFTVVICTSAFVFIQSITVALYVFLFTIFILVLGRKIIYKKLLLLILVSNTLFMFFGNLLFSPKTNESLQFFIFEINALGAERGLVGALKRNAMIIMSFAWLSCSSAYIEIYRSLEFIAPLQKTLMVFLRWLQNINRDFLDFYHSLVIRGLNPRSMNLRKKLNQLRIVLTAILNRFFINIGKMTFAGESHFLLKKETLDGSINVRNLCVKYFNDGPLVLSDFDLLIESGDFVFLHGADESGKTTLLRAISGFIPRIIGEITQGQVEISGKVIDNTISIKQLSEKLRFIIDNPSESIIGLTVGQEIMTFTADEIFARACLKKMDIEELWERETSKLSGGEQVRLVLASLLASQTKILLLDSPLSQLDPKGRRIFIKALQELIENYRPTVVVSDQFIELFEPMISRLIVLEKGKILNDQRIASSSKELLTKIIDSNRIKSAIKPGLSDNELAIPIAQLRNIHFSIDNTQILTEVNLKISPSECVAIMGANGSGKTTAMLILAGAIKSTTGDVLLTCDQCVGYVFQNSASQILSASVHEELLLTPIIKNWNKKEINEFLEHWLTWLELDPENSTIDLHPAKRRMLAIASMLAGTKVIIFDEPTIDLDIEKIDRIVSLIDNLLRIDKSVIVVTHDRRLALLASRIIVMDGGRIVADTKEHYEAFKILDANE